MYNFYFLTQHSFSGTFVIPYLWCSLKTYYEENGINADKWIWQDPFLYEKTDEEIFEQLEKNPPHVFGFSVYVWNEFRLDNLAKQIKEKYPDCVIIYGGPQQNVKHNPAYFMKKHWVDASLHADAYGEPVLTKILDSYPEIKWYNVPAVYYTDKAKTRYTSPNTIDKKAFVWPKAIFPAQEHLILDRLIQAQENNEEIQVYFETSRGCPYRCIYCEWGGGIGTKVVKKPWETIITDIDWLIIKAKASGLDIVDANFGIFKQDIDLAKHIVNRKKEYGYPNTVDFDSAKNNPDNVLAIRDLFWENDIARVYTVSVQTLNEEARKNIERVDISLSRHVENINYLKSKYGEVTVYIERIIGLPGETLESMYDQLDAIYDVGLQIGTSKPVSWVLLPEAPAFDPAMRERFKIKTINKLFDFNPKLKDNRVIEYPASSISVVSNSWVNPEIETVIGTYSYDMDEWVEMRNVLSWALAGQFIGLNNYFIRYLFNTYGTKPSEVYKFIRKLAYHSGFGISDLDNMVKRENDQTYAWLNNADVKDALIDLGDAWPFTIPSQAVLGLGLLKNLPEFYKILSDYYSQKYNDPKIIDLCKWLTDAVIDITYNPDFGRKFESDYNWLSYFHKNEDLTQGKFRYIISDFDGTDNRYAWWHKQENTLYRDIAYYCQVVAITSSSTYETKLASSIRLDSEV